MNYDTRPTHRPDPGNQQATQTGRRRWSRQTPMLGVGVGGAVLGGLLAAALISAPSVTLTGYPTQDGISQPGTAATPGAPDAGSIPAPPAQGLVPAPLAPVAGPGQFPPPPPPVGGPGQFAPPPPPAPGMIPAPPAPGLVPPLGAPGHPIR